MKKQFYTLISLLLLLLQSFYVLAQNPYNPYKAPLYWSPYEYNIVHDNYIPESEWLANINWMQQNLLPYGYKMICIDGWGDDGQYNQYGYRTTHSSTWSHDYAYWSNYLLSRGMTLGIYNNPLWINKRAADAGVLIKGTNIPLSTLVNPDEVTNNYLFKWVMVNKPGAEQYVKGYIQYYADMGVKFLRVDFLSWFEDGIDKGNRVGVDRDSADYRTALRWMREACDANGMFLSLVMPHLKYEASRELQYGHMIRINEDAGLNAGWGRFSDMDRGISYPYWSRWHSAFDGYEYWSRISGRNKMILDGDFIRLNKFANDEEKKTVISLHLMAGGPLSVSDQYNSIGNDLWLYQNNEMLALNQDGFVGKPLFNDPTDKWNVQAQIWKGQMSNGDWIVGLFNREGAPLDRNINFATDLGISGAASVRDLWKHQDLGTMTSFTANVPAHGCVVIRISGSGNLNALPSPWQRTDIGSVSPSGSASYNNGNFSNKGSGADIEGTSDAFSFIYQKITGDVTITAKVNSIDNIDSWSKAGVMIRQTLDANSVNAMEIVTPSNGIAFQNRSSTGGGTTSSVVGGVMAPYWLRVARTGNYISSYRSADGVNWTQTGTTITLNMSADVYVGLATTSHSNGTLATGVFSDVSITNFPSPWVQSNVGSATPSGSASYSNGAFTIKGAGADIEGTADGFYYTYYQVAGDMTLTAKVLSISNTNAWAKAGVMIRETMNANAANAMTALTASNGLIFQNRSVTGGGTTGTVSSGISAPYWVRIKRTGNSFISYQSADGLNWTQVGSPVTINMVSNAFIGLAVTSHADGNLCQATFSNVTVSTSSGTAAFQAGQVHYNDPAISPFKTSVFPNPADQVIHVLLANAQGEKVQVVLKDVSGKTLFQKETTDHELSINTSWFAAGLYFIQLNSASIHLSEKVVIK